MAAGCGCKLAPNVLQQLLADQPLATPYMQLLVGAETADDAAVWQLDDNTCIIATTEDGIWLVSFMHYDLGYIDLEQKTLQTIDNPLGTRLSPMS
jgi:selenophosphate synthase